MATLTVKQLILELANYWHAGVGKHSTGEEYSTSVLISCGSTRLATGDHVEGLVCVVDHERNEGAPDSPVLWPASRSEFHTNRNEYVNSEAMNPLRQLWLLEKLQRMVEREIEKVRKRTYQANAPTPQ